MTELTKKFIESQIVFPTGHASKGDYTSVWKHPKQCPERGCSSDWRILTKKKNIFRIYFRLGWSKSLRL